MNSENAKKLTYKNLDRDIERCCEKSNEKQMGIQVYRGYYKARTYVFNTYLEKKLYAEVVDYLLCQNWEWGVNEFFEKTIQALQEEKEFGKLRRLWRGVIASQTQNYWALQAINKTDPDVKKIMLLAREISLTHLSRYRETLQSIDEIKEIDWLDSEIALIESGERRHHRSRPDSRKIDENLFWDLIENARTTSDSTAQQIDVLISDLEQFKASEIKNFQLFIDKKMCAAYRWDLWALAYISQDGCSDDGFEDFRAWLILQGKEIFDAALRDIRKVLNVVPAGHGTQVERLHNVSAIAYVSRTGEILSPLKAPQCKLKGVPWEEERLGTLFPEVCKHYNFKT